MSVQQNRTASSRRGAVKVRIGYEVVRLYGCEFCHISLKPNQSCKRVGSATYAHCRANGGDEGGDELPEETEKLLLVFWCHSSVVFKGR